MDFQKTIAHSIKYVGIGLHSGAEVTIILHPGAENTGVVFRRTDLPGFPEVKADIANVTQTMRATTLERGAAKVFTVEHLLAAFYICGVDNCLVEINSVEPPVADGSARVFIELIESVGVVAQRAKRRYFVIEQPLAIEADGKFIALFPGAGFRLSYSSYNKHPLLGFQYFDSGNEVSRFNELFGAARTIGFSAELAMLQANGLAKGGSLDNALVFTEDGTLNPMRYPDELARHKVLDIVGDLFLVGRIIGRVIALNSSHELNAKMAQKLRATFKE
ncbi:MAG: UDP-3-O-acyl-N-acetylglucosamine deacetylase [Negativicutes bacterium]